MNTTDAKSIKRPKTTGRAPSGEHGDNAKRFLEMCNTLLRILPNYRRTVPPKQSESNYPEPKLGEDYLITHLKAWVQKHVLIEKHTTRTSLKHEVMIYGGDGRRSLPSTICAAIHMLDNPKPVWGLSTDQKVPVTWIVCYLNNIRPDTTEENWQSFDCSHRCISYDLKGSEGQEQRLECIDKACLCWESKSYNQSRGNWFCCKICTHTDCAKIVCLCQQIHDPPCI